MPFFRYFYNNLTCLVPEDHICDNHFLCKDLSDECDRCSGKNKNCAFRCDNGQHIYADDNPVNATVY